MDEGIMECLAWRIAVALERTADAAEKSLALSLEAQKERERLIAATEASAGMIEHALTAPEDPNLDS